MAKEVAEEYASSLKDLTFNSKPHISVLTMLAEENHQYAGEIVKVIENHLQKVKSECKLPALYLIDSILKNTDGNSNYQALFALNIVSTFCGVFEKVDEKTRMQLYKLRQTWGDLFPAKKLYAIDVRVQTLDPAWPITAPPTPEPPSIHVNPKFLQKPAVEEPVKVPAPTAHTEVEVSATDIELRRQLLSKQQELLRLQQENLELELMRTKAQLEEQKRQMQKMAPVAHEPPVPVAQVPIKMPPVSHGRVSDIPFPVASCPPVMPGNSGSNRVVISPAVQPFPQRPSHVTPAVTVERSAPPIRPPANSRIVQPTSRDPRLARNLQQSRDPRVAKATGQTVIKNTTTQNTHRDRQKDSSTVTPTTKQVPTPSINDTAAKTVKEEPSKKSPTKQEIKSVNKRTEKTQSPIPEPSDLDVKLKKQNNNSPSRKKPERNSKDSSEKIPSKIKAEVIPTKSPKKSEVKKNEKETPIDDKSGIGETVAKPTRKTPPKSYRDIVNEDENATKKVAVEIEKYLKISERDQIRKNLEKEQIRKNLEKEQIKKNLENEQIKKNLENQQIKKIPENEQIKKISERVQNKRKLEAISRENEVRKRIEESRSRPMSSNRNRRSRSDSQNRRSSDQEHRFNINKRYSDGKHPRSPEPRYYNKNDDMSLGRRGRGTSGGSYRSDPRSERRHGSPPRRDKSRSRSQLNARDRSPAVTQPVVAETKDKLASENKTQINPVTQTNETSKLNEMQENGHAVAFKDSDERFAPAHPATVFITKEETPTKTEDMETEQDIKKIAEKDTTENKSDDKTLDKDERKVFSDEPALQESDRDERIASSDEKQQESDRDERKASSDEKLASKDETPQQMETETSFVVSDAKVENMEVDVDKDARVFDMEIQVESPKKDSDVDLRIAESAVKRDLEVDEDRNANKENVDEPPAKKGKPDADSIDDLFGAADQDYRIPPPASAQGWLPPARDGDSTGWTKYKMEHPEEFKTTQIFPIPVPVKDEDLRDIRFQPNQDLLRRESVSESPRVLRDPALRRGYGPTFKPTQFEQECSNFPPEGEAHIPQELQFEKRKEILLHADAQLRSGQITEQQHKDLMDQLAHVYQLQESKRGRNWFPMDPARGEMDGMMFEHNSMFMQSRFSPGQVVDRREQMMRRHEEPSPLYTRRPRINKPETSSSPRSDLLENIVLPIDGKPRELRFIDGTAVVLIDGIAKELFFKSTPREVCVNHMTFLLKFDGCHELFFNNKPFRFMFGAPTRELILNGIPFQATFGGAPIKVNLDGVILDIKLSGPPPGVSLGRIRKDVVTPDGKWRRNLKFRRNLQEQRMWEKEKEFSRGFGRGVRPMREVIVRPPFAEGGFPRHPMIPRAENFNPMQEDINRGDGWPFRNSSNQRLSPIQFDKDWQGGPRLRPPMPGPSVAPSFPPMGGPRFPNSPQRFEEPAFNPVIQPHDMPQNVPSVVNIPEVMSSAIPPPIVHSEDSGQGLPLPPAEILPLDNLLQKLASYGIIPAGRAPNADKTTEEPTSTQETHEEMQIKNEFKKIPIIFFTPESLRRRRDSVINVQYYGMQCASCGVRFPTQNSEKYAQHLDWHFRQNRRERESSKKAGSRRWFYDTQDWTQFEEVEDLEDRAQNFFEMQASEEQDESDEEVPSVPAGQNEEENTCAVCKERFEQFWNEEKEEWCLKDAIREDEKTYHPLCHKDTQAKPGDTEAAESKNEAGYEVINIQDDPVEVVFVDLENEEDIKDDEPEVIQPEPPTETPSIQEELIPDKPLNPDEDVDKPSSLPFLENLQEEESFFKADYIPPHLLPKPGKESPVPPAEPEKLDDKTRTENEEEKTATDSEPQETSAQIDVAETDEGNSSVNENPVIELDCDYVEKLKEWENPYESSDGDGKFQVLAPVHRGTENSGLCTIL